ncbi:DUF2203 domain-containing protein [Candidatus Woesearchaeota archaeon]|nr:DUF2203 domain-containing protein [Candidatus Woesearchaeota archaeon]
MVEMDNPPKNYISMDEARTLLPGLRKRLTRLMRIHRALSLMQTIHLSYDDNHAEVISQIKQYREFHRLSYQIYKNLDELFSKGCIVKDLDIGLVDFYSRFGGRDILLCWQLGEADIQYWHEVDGGYEGRKPISKLIEGRV